MLAAALTEGGLARGMGVFAVALAAVNVFGGFLDAPHAGDVQEEGQEAGQGGRAMISLNLVTLLYLVASVCFIQALKGLSHPPRPAWAMPSAWPAWRSPC